MPVVTGVSPLLRRPQTFHVFTFLLGGRGLVPLPQRVALVGAKTAAGTAVNGTIYEVSSSDVSDGLFGVGSELALMCRQAYLTAGQLGQGPNLFAVSLAESAGVAATRTITVTGTASADGTAIIRVAGRTVQVGIRNGDVQNTTATAISNALKQISETLPVSISVAANVVTTTHNTKGVNGNDVVVQVDQSVAGVTITPANAVAGTLVTDHQPALDALSALPFDGIVFANHAAADITEVSADILLRWSYSEKRFRWYFFGEMGTIGTATALASSANHQAVVINSMEGALNTAGEMATALAIAAFSRNRPNANYDGMTVPLYPPPLATVYTPTEVETAIAAGLTPLTAVLDPNTRSVIQGVSKIERMITTKTTQGGFPFEVLRDFAVGRTAAYLAIQLDIAYAQRFGAGANPDGTLLTDDTIAQVRDMVVAILRAAEDAQILRNVTIDLASLIVERDLVTPGRINVDLTYTVVVGLHQIAYIHRVKLF